MSKDISASVVNSSHIESDHLSNPSDLNMFFMHEYNTARSTRVQPRVTVHTQVSFDL